jgi:hypothetical protein
VVDAMSPDSIDVEAFVDGWWEPDTQAAMKALVAKLGK